MCDRLSLQSLQSAFLERDRRTARIPDADASLPVKRQWHFEFAGGWHRLLTAWQLLAAWERQTAWKLLAARLRRHRRRFHRRFLKDVSRVLREVVGEDPHDEQEDDEKQRSHEHDGEALSNRFPVRILLDEVHVGFVLFQLYTFVRHQYTSITSSYFSTTGSSGRGLTT